MDPEAVCYSKQFDVLLSQTQNDLKKPAPILVIEGSDSFKDIDIFLHYLEKIQFANPAKGYEVLCEKGDHASFIKINEQKDINAGEEERKIFEALYQKIYQRLLILPIEKITNNYKLPFLTTTNDLNKEILEQIEKKVLSTNPDADPKNYPDDLT
ncbi:26001_t:CDS:2, partial [Gigaspora rosea]